MEPKMPDRVLMKHETAEFYCWRWQRWVRWRKLNYCCGCGCGRMQAPPALHWKAALLGGVLVPAGSKQ